MRIVWSLWTTPVFSGIGSRWLELRYWIYAWILSFKCAKTYYTEKYLFTDDLGARLLVDGLGLDFSVVDTRLNSLRHYDPRLWAIGKILTYRLQNDAFLHIDSDVFLWDQIASRILDAPVFAQSPEPFEPWDGQWYSPQILEAFLLGCGGWLPREWYWYRENKELAQEGACCGIFGGNNLDFIHYYADLAFQMIDHGGNKNGLLMMPNMEKNIVLLEQYLLSAVSNYYMCNPCRDFHSTKIEYLFNEPDSTARASEVGYTHLIGPAKKSVEICKRLEKRIQSYFPYHYEKAEKLLGKLLTYIN